MRGSLDKIGCIGWSAMTAAMVRFRPILMTVLAMIFGLLPLGKNRLEKIYDNEK